MSLKEESLEESTHRVSTSGDLEVSAYLEIAREKHGEAPLAEGGRAATGRESIVILDFGSQYSQLIARRVRECKVYCELVPFDAPWERVAHLNPRGFILSGGPSSVYDAGAPMAPPYVFESRLPVLGICYGMQLLAHQMGGKVVGASRREYGHAILHQSDDSALFRNLPASLSVWMSHGDHILELPPGFHTLAYTENAPIAAMGNESGVIGIQFHPEVAHTPQGKDILRNFLYHVCGCEATWTAASFIQESVSLIRKQVDTGRVICALSGGVDSSVAATLIHKAIGDQLTCIFVNNGLLRKEEAERTLRVFQRHLNMNVLYVDASERFLKRLHEVVDPETKRKAIGEEFIRVFEEEAKLLGKVDFLAQGTLYPDVIESVTPENKAAAKIKTHHNVGGLPRQLNFTLIEPLRYLFKDEVREVGMTLGLPDEMVWRQPFPGPGLAIRIIGEVTRERLNLLRDADSVVINEMKKAKQYGQVWQSFAILTPLRTVGVMGDARTYSNVVALRVVTSEDAMTADWARLPYDLLARISNRIINEVPGINRVVYDITSKPPGTIEWE